MRKWKKKSSWIPPLCKLGSRSIAGVDATSQGYHFPMTPMRWAVGKFTFFELFYNLMQFEIPAGMMSALIVLRLFGFPVPVARFYRSYHAVNHDRLHVLLSVDVRCWWLRRGILLCLFWLLYGVVDTIAGNDRELNQASLNSGWKCHLTNWWVSWYTLFQK